MIEVVTGPPFAGKGQYVRDEIARREDAGRLGLIAVDFTAIFTAIAWGVQSSYRDENVSDTGAPRLARTLYEAALAAVIARQLHGYVTTNSPRRAIAISDRLDGAPILDVAVSVEDMAERSQAHLTGLRRRVPRARGEDADARCRKAGQTYIRERPVLEGRAREVTQNRKGEWKTGQTVRPFDRVLFERGLTPAGRKARDELVAEGNTDWTPTDIFNKLMQTKGRR